MIVLAGLMGAKTETDDINIDSFPTEVCEMK
jgi:hypothetical protein